MTTRELLPSPSPPSIRMQMQMEDEFELLCASAGTELSAERTERIANWNLSALDWGRFLRLAEHHGVLPLAARNLVEHGRGFPPEVERSLQSRYQANLRRSLWFTAELARIMQHFASRKVRVLPFKGPLLAQSLYQDVGLRSFSDLDFLISPTDFDRAKLALAEIGYRPTTDVTPPIERLWLRTGYERSFDSVAAKNLVELQWALLPHFYAVDLQLENLRVEDLLERAGPTLVGGCEMTSLAPEDLLLVLCLHAAKHLWTRLIWLSDIAAALRLPLIDYTLVLSRARATGIARILAVSFWLVKNVLHGELPKPVEEMAAADSEVASCGSEFAGRLARGTPYDFESTEYFRLVMRLRERRGDRWRFLWRLVWTPGAGDVAAVRLPEGLFPLYRVVRIGRLARKVL
jgi:hypothetical protein